jgi:hypothetical protein
MQELTIQDANKNEVVISVTPLFEQRVKEHFKIPDDATPTHDQMRDFLLKVLLKDLKKATNG